MKFLLKRRLNPFLLLTTIVGLSLLVGLSIAYQTQLNEVTDDFQSMEEDYAETEAKLDAAKENLTKVDVRENELEEHVSDLQESLRNRDDSIEDLEGTVEELESEVESLEEERNEYRSDLETAELDIRDLCEIEDIENSISEDICDLWAEGWDNEN